MSAHQKHFVTQIFNQIRKLYIRLSISTKITMQRIPKNSLKRKMLLKVARNCRAFENTLDFTSTGGNYYRKQKFS
jgi:hypothetical protein